MGMQALIALKHPPLHRRYAAFSASWLLSPIQYWSRRKHGCLNFLCMSSHTCPNLSPLIMPPSQTSFLNCLWWYCANSYTSYWAFLVYLYDFSFCFHVCGHTWESAICCLFFYRPFLQQFSFTCAASPSTLSQVAVSENEKEQVGCRRTTELKSASLVLT